MLPFVGIDESKIAPFHPFGVCCALAFFAWDHVGMKMAERRGFERDDFRVFTILIGILGWGFAWGIDALFYHPTATEGAGIQRLSATGAIVGATVAAIVWSRFRFARWHVTRRPEPFALLPISEVIVATWPVAQALGRLGCALIHDHVGKAVAPGTLSSLLAVGFPRSADDGVHHAFGPVHIVFGGSDVRFDVGLLEMIVATGFAIAFARLWKRDVPMGTFTMWGALVYGPIRFVLDFLRADDGATGDARLAGLTFAQYWAIAVTALGVFLLVRRKTKVPSHAT